MSSFFCVLLFMTIESSQSVLSIVYFTYFYIIIVYALSEKSQRFICIHPIFLKNHSQNLKRWSFLETIIITLQNSV